MPCVWPKRNRNIMVCVEWSLYQFQNVSDVSYIIFFTYEIYRNKDNHYSIPIYFEKEVKRAMINQMSIDFVEEICKKPYFYST